MEDLRLDFVDSNRALLISISTERGKQQSQLLIPFESMEAKEVKVAFALGKMVVIQVKR